MASLPNDQNKAKYVQDTFNSIAGSYDLMNTIMTAGLDKKWRKLTVQLSEIKSGGKGLDVCCGTGKLTMELSRTAGPTGELVGLDFSEKMLAVARENIREFSLRDTISFVQGDAMHLPLADNRFDCATVGWGLRNVPDTFAAVQEMVRVVRPGGKVVSLDMAQPTLPVFKKLYWFIFQSVVPAIGKIFSGNRKAYAYLHDSAKAFLNQQELAKLFTAAGLVDVRYHNLLGGAIAIVEGRKAPLN